MNNKKFLIFNFSAGRGFTIVELLVVVAIAAFILSLVFVFLRDAKSRGRDARREEDIKQIRSALDIYHINRRQFPACPQTLINGLDDCLSQDLLADGAINAVARDPLHGGTGECLAAGSYVYCYESVNGSDYILRYNLETDSIPGKSAGWQEARP